MPIILKGSGEEFSKINSKFAEIKVDSAHKQVIGYLLYELAGLKDFSDIKTRLKAFKEEREKILDLPGMKTKEGTLPPNAENLEKILKEALKLVKADYMSVANQQKINLDASNWEDDSEKAAYEYFRYVLKNHAEKFVMEAKAKK